MDVAGARSGDGGIVERIWRIGLFGADIEDMASVNRGKFLASATAVVVVAGLLGFVGSQLMKPSDGPSQMISSSEKTNTPSATSTDTPKVPGGKLVEPSKQDFSEDIADPTIPLESRQAMAYEAITCPAGTDRVNDGTFEQAQKSYLLVSCISKEGIKTAVYLWTETKWTEAIGLDSGWSALRPVKAINYKKGLAIVGIDTTKHIVALVVSADGSVSLDNRFNPNL